MAKKPKPSRMSYAHKPYINKLVKDKNAVEEKEMASPAVQKMMKDVGQPDEPVVGADQGDKKAKLK
ncbi:hypothetical protein M011DRAFT_485193 [Sporormia fimetaria CBS 119925]|uniref:Uncharacterized protein n=1 Tax=Sporormia fimetaria CBS 119925 TaxID=1340428 RepID=A0A6A6VFY4_9PLEO|nr:hypothetical protein M011DRAFT_485193 [Sporormia fimetaria CBS 119925]